MTTTKYGTLRCSQPPANATNGGAQLQSFDANQATIPAVGGAAVTSRNGHPLVAFDDTTDESAIFNGEMSADYTPATLTINVLIMWAAATAVAGDVVWAVAFEAIAPGGQDLDVDGFAAAKSITDTAPGTSGVTSRATLTFTQAEADGVEPLDAYRLRVMRDADAGGDDMAGDAQILSVMVTQV